MGTVENLKFESDSFDLIWGTALLHHVNIEKASVEIRRVLKDSGKAIFMEPIVFSSVLDTIRHHPLVTYFVPDEGAEVLITEDEHQITTDEYKVLLDNFSQVNYKTSRLLSRLDRIISGYPVNEKNPFVILLNKVDRILLENFSFLKNYGAWAVIELKK